MLFFHVEMSSFRISEIKSTYNPWTLDINLNLLSNYTSSWPDADGMLVNHRTYITRQSRKTGSGFRWFLTHPKVSRDEIEDREYHFSYREFMKGARETNGTSFSLLNKTALTFDKRDFGRYSFLIFGFNYVLFHFWSLPSPSLALG